MAAGGSVATARQFLRFLWTSARWQVVGAVTLSVVLSLTEGVSLALVFPLIALLGSPGGGALAGPRTQWLLHGLAACHIPQRWWLATILVVVLSSVALLTQLQAVLATLTTGIILRVRQELADRIFHAILHADWTYLTRRRASDLAHYLTAELPRAGTLAGSFIAVLSNGMVALLMLGIAIYLAPVLTLVILAALGLLVPWQRRVGRRIYRSGDEVSERMREVFDSSTERLGNLKVVKAYGAQDAELALFSRRYDAVVEQLIANEWRGISAGRWFQLFTVAVLCAVILLGLGPLHLAAGTMLIFLFAFLRASPRMQTVQSKGNEILSELPAYRSITTFLAECEVNHERGAENATAPALRVELVLKAVRFAYGEQLPMVLDGVDLRLRAGKITAVAGLSGAGKSTVADLVMGLLLPVEGAVEVDGQAITRENARAWRANVGYVSQDTLLFHDSIRANLLWARPEATDEELRAALGAASAEFVWGLAQGISTVVGDRGMMLSHGQRQRIALARAFLLQPTLLILDEATNSLDLDNEETILRSVAARGNAVTTLLISHRPSAVRVADWVYVLEGGRVARAGTWDEVRGMVEAQATSGG